MRRVELLAPAGSAEALFAAVQNGCDAVYLGGHKFNARAYSDNFDRETMIQAIQYAHGYGVKVYVTMNTLLYENEIEEAIAYARFLYEQGVDALIIQDLGLFDAVRRCFPEMECHASTQLHIHNEAGIQNMAKLGFSRIVLPRETPLEEVRQYAALGVELEVFVQGALCVSYSGQCLMSAKKLNRSGNRGACAQMCRMKYRLGYQQNNTVHYVKQSGDYLISPKDLNTLKEIPQLIEAGITSFKIEGRMKRPEYVAQTVSLYRRAIDAYKTNSEWNPNDVLQSMRKVFHRGFTSGLLFHQNDSAFINHNRPNHIGVVIGEVIQRHKNKVTIRLCAELNQYDGIRFINEKEDIGCMVNKLYRNGLLVNHGEKGDIVAVEADGLIQKGDKVVKTADKKQLEALRKTYEQTNRRVPIVMKMEMHIGKTAVLKVSDDLGNDCEVNSSTLAEKALKTALSRERIQQQLQKTKDTVFEAVQIHIAKDDDATMPIKELNAMRRAALTKLYEMRIAVSARKVNSYHQSVAPKPVSGLFVKVMNEEQLQAASHYPVRIFAASVLFKNKQSSCPQLGFWGKRVMKEAYPDAASLVCEISGCFQKDVIADHFLNCTNSYAAAFLFSLGVKGIILSNECDERQAAAIKRAFYQRYHEEGAFITYDYGREELMLSEYCVIHACLKDQEPRHCGLCRKHDYFLEDIKKHRYLLYGDEDCRMHLLDDEIYQLKEPASAVYLDFFNETADEVHQIIQNTLNSIQKHKETNKYPTE